MKFKDYIYSLAFNSFQLVTIVAATIYGSVGATRLVVFMSMVTLFIAFIGAGFVKPALSAAWDKGKDRSLIPYRTMLHPFKKVFSRVTDLVSVSILIYFGFWFSGMAIGLGALFAESIWDQVQDFLDEKKVA